MQLTLEMEWHDAPGEIIKQLLPLHSPVISPSLSGTKSNF
jgi:ACT domain-containing protein